MSRLRIMQMTNEELERRQKDGTMYADFVPIGHWERDVDFGNVAHDYCSECHYEGKGTNFCPNCGADLREQAPTKSVLDEVAGELEELEKTEPFAYGDTKIRMGVGLGIMKARKIIDNYREEGDEGIEEGITTFVEGKYDPIYIGYNSHDCEAMYKCPKCGEVHGSWEWFGKREFTCNCGATWNVPE